MQYHNLRNAYHNQEKIVFEGVGQYDTPPLKPVDISTEGCQLIRFDYSLRESHPEDKIVHFYTDDYVFERVWREPERYLQILARFRAVITPDFSLYTDYPRVTQLFNHFRRHWLGAYWQSMGLTVIPNIRWIEGDMSSFKWCLDGEPTQGTICISTHGAIKGDWRKSVFLEGWNQVITRLDPHRIILVGDTFEGLSFNGVLEHVPLDSMVKKRKYCRKVV